MAVGVLAAQSPPVPQIEIDEEEMEKLVPVSCAPCRGYMMLQLNT